MTRAAGLLALLCAGAVATGRAQQGGDTTRAARLGVELRRDSAGAIVPPVVRASGLLADGAFLGALRNGFPVRLVYRLELWRDARLFDRHQSEATWEAVVILDPVSETYELLRSTGAVERHQNAVALAAALAIPYTVALLPPEVRSGRWYYLATLDIESLSISELEEVERWLRGDLRRAIGERGDLGDAFSRGARTALIRLSGLPHRRLEARTPRFR